MLNIFPAPVEVWISARQCPKQAKMKSILKAIDALGNPGEAPARLFGCGGTYSHAWKLLRFGPARRIFGSLLL
jgi:hypothetical protein